MFEAYLAEVDAARTNGYAVDPGNYVKGVTTVSAPVLDGGRPIMAISAVCFSAQLDASAVTRLGNDIKAIAERLSGVFTERRSGTAGPP
jgi:DNA-binding IclR family transcriptional regulator